MSSGQGTPYFQGIRIGQRGVPAILERNRQLTADNRWGIYVGPLGRGRHRVKLPHSDQTFIVSSSSPLASFTPGAAVIIGSNTGRPGEVLLGLPSSGKVGLSQNPGSFESSITPIPAAPAAETVQDALGDKLWAYYNALDQGESPPLVGGKVVQLTDLSGNGRHQDDQAFPANYPYWDLGFAAWRYTGTENTNGVNIAAVSAPIRIWLVHYHWSNTPAYGYDPPIGRTGPFLNWSNGSLTLLMNGGGPAALTGVAKSAWHWSRVDLLPGETTLNLNGNRVSTAGGTGGTMDTIITGGSNVTEMRGYIRAHAIAVGEPTPGQIEDTDALFAFYASGAYAS